MSKGYTVIDPGQTHRCALPSTNRFANHAQIRCDGCGKDWWKLELWTGDSWVDWTPTGAAS